MSIARISRSRRIYVNQGAIFLEYKEPRLEAIGFAVRYLYLVENINIS